MWFTIFIIEVKRKACNYNWKTQYVNISNELIEMILQKFIGGIILKQTEQGHIVEINHLHFIEYNV